MYPLSLSLSLSLSLYLSISFSLSLSPPFSSQGGGQLALLFSGQLPPGPKWLSFISQTRPEYVHQVEAIENNAVALTTIIPSKSSKTPHIQCTMYCLVGMVL